MEDRNRVSRLVGQKVAAALKITEGQSATIVATLHEVRDDGIVLSEIDDLGSGPTLFCPWDSLKRVRDRPPFFMLPHERLESDEYYELYEHREVSQGEVESYLERRRASALNLERVVPIAQRRAVGEVTVALTSLELFGEGVGVLRYRISYGAGMFEGGYGIPEPELVVRDGSGRELSWSPQGSSSSESEADGEVEVRGLPEAGELEVEVPRLVSLVYDEEAGEERVEDSYDGPWAFRFAI